MAMSTPIAIAIAIPIPMIMIMLPPLRSALTAHLCFVATVAIEIAVTVT